MNEEQWNGISDKIPKAYWTREVAESLGISDSYLRKWCLELEKNGYKFLKVKDGKNRDNRAFTEHDVIALRKFQSLLSQPNVTKSQVAQIISKDYAPVDRDTKELSSYLRDNDRDKAQKEVHDLILKDVIHELRHELGNVENNIIASLGERIEERLSKKIEGQIENFLARHLLLQEERIEERVKNIMSQYLERQETTMKETFNQIQTSQVQDRSSTENNEKIISELKNSYINQQMQNETREKELQKELSEREEQLKEVLKELKTIKEHIAVTNEKKGFISRLFGK
ncbi:hypothetical protein [Priestia megaterium]|jgi:hypothetical protein|uniref:hypothetical protein n=1 Tax=Priestia megaterium TaxID=1404 RepID=UPI002452BC8A|nr:hypothetical protein [Priestia megaterium]MDH3155941.1 hypothetical protein [Priestia megaterium]MED4116355.1 hypothetical protein [Priestia megaterium]